MTDEEKDFNFFKNNQLYFVDFATGRIDTKAYRRANKVNKYYWRISKDVGSINEDGYSRIRCNNHLRMKHRFIFWLYHGYVPAEVDHIDKNRNNNSISNLREVTHAENVKGLTFNGRKKFTNAELHQICKMIASKQYTDSQIANQFNCKRVTIMGIRTKYRHASIGSLYF